MIAGVDTLYRHLCEIFTKELIKLNTGYSFDESTLSHMNDLVSAIEFLKYDNPTQSEALTVIQRYDRYYKPKNVNFSSQANSRDFYKGTSFRWAGTWEPGKLYANDTYFIDVVSYNGSM